MCGIVALIGIFEYTLVIKCLKKLQNRGYDSAGFSYIHNNKLNIKKKIYKESINELYKICYNLDKNNKNNMIKSCISHTRWATHGRINNDNCHPHISNNKKISLVHNGIIENYLELKNFLIDNNYTFYSETDSEVIVNLIQYYYELNNNIDVAINKTLNLCDGTWALIIQFIDIPNCIYAIRRGSPLLVGKNAEFVILTSETSAFNNTVSNYKSLNSNILYKFNNETNIETGIKLTRNNTYNKYNYEHWMLKEIYDQNNIIYNITKNYSRLIYDENNENNYINFGGIKPHISKILNCNHLVLIGCGTSYNACCYSKSFFYDLCNFKTITCINACNYNKNDIPKSDKNLYIFVSQSGETKDLYDILLKVQGFKIGIVNVVDSLIARSVDCGVYLNIGKEISVASTKAFTAQALLLSLLSINLSSDKLKINLYLRDFMNLQKLIDYQLENELFVKPEDLIKYKNGFILGNCNDGINFICDEIALKFKEITYIHIESLSTNSLKHGPLSLVSENDFICILLGNNQSTKEEILSRFGNVINFNINYDNKYNNLLYIFQFQKLIYYLSILKNIDPDYPRNLAKVVTV